MEHHRSSVGSPDARFDPDLERAPELRFEHITTVQDGDPREMLRGVDDLEEFERRFGTTLSVREADPTRLGQNTPQLGVNGG